MRFVAVEIWVRMRLIEAPDEQTAYEAASPDPVPPELGLNLSNWHVCPTQPTNPIPVREFDPNRKAN